MSKEWIFSDDFKIKFSDKLFNEFMSTDNFKWTDEIVKEYGEWFKQKSDVFSSNPLYLVEQFKELKASKQKSVFKDKDWEIVSLRYKLNGNVWVKVNDNRFELPDTQWWLPASNIYNDNNYEIYSVKRLSDNEVFSIDEQIADRKEDYYTNRVIEKFIPYNEKMYVVLKDLKGLLPLTYLVKKKQPLFTTEDGQGIFTKQPLWLVILKDLSKRYGIVSLKGQTEVMEYVYMPENVKYFYSEEAANEYILMNKPCLSVQDLKNTFNSHHFGEGEY